MNASLLYPNQAHGQIQALTTLVRQLRREVEELRSENEELRSENTGLRRQVSELRCDVGYWKSMHARAVERNAKLQEELDLAKAEIRQLKAERFGKQSEKRSAIDRSNQLEDPSEQAAAKRKRGQQPDRPAPKRRDYSHLPAREETVDLPDEAKHCACCGLPLADLGHAEDSQQIEIETVVYRQVIRRKRYRRRSARRSQTLCLLRPAAGRSGPRRRQPTNRNRNGRLPSRHSP